MRIDVFLLNISMKRAILFFTLLAMVSCGGTKGKTRSLHDDEVYVCTGKYAKRFHCDEDCKGLQSCRGGIYTAYNLKEI